MTVINNDARNQYIAIAAQTIFAYDFEISDQDNIQVYQRSSGSTPDDAADLLAITVDYTVTGVGVNTGGTIVLNSGATVGDIITLQGNAPPVRSTTFQPGGVIQAANLNTEFDDEILIYQTILAVQNNLIPRYQKSAVINDFDLVLPVLEPGQTWVMNSAGDEIVGADIPTDGFAPLDMTYLTLSDESAFLTNSYQLVAGTGITLVQAGNTVTIDSTGGTVVSITANNGLDASPNPIIGTGDIGLASIATLTGLVNTTGGAAVPTATTLTAWLDAAIGNTRGDILYRDAAGWVVLAPGTAGYILATGGAGADPSWIANDAGTVTSIAAGAGIEATPDPIVSTGSIALAAIADHTLLANISGGALAPSSTTLTALIDNAIGNTRGDILYRGAAAWSVLAPGTAGFSLQTGGAGADPSYSNTFTSSTLVTPATLGVQQAALNMNSHLINNVTDPVSPQDAATMAFVLATNQGRIFKDPCLAASTGALTATYNNGASGVGATLTNAGAMAAFSLDGEAGVLNGRYLIKDQAGAEAPWNGIYTLTTVGSGAANWVLTRAVDNDIAAEFLYATTYVQNGTVNNGRTFTQTATIVTVGTTNVVWVQSGDASGVTSVTFTGDGTVLSSTPSSAVTSAGTVTATLNTQSANTVLAGPTSGGAANPTFRALVAADFPSWQTFTPTITLVGGAGNTVPVYTTNAGRYCQFGKTVFVNVVCQGDGGAEGAGTGRINVALPVQASASITNGSPNSSGFAVGYANNNATEYQLYGIITASATTMGLEYFNTVPTTASFMGNDQNNTNRQFNLQFFYESV